MLEDIDHLERAFDRSQTIDGALDIAQKLVSDLGFTSFIYDYSPVVLSHQGDLITPTHVSMRNVPHDMMELWCDGGFYQNDPVQNQSVNSTMPFVYSCNLDNNPTVLAQSMTKRHQPVITYLHDVQMTCGISVPIQHTRGDLATCTAVWRGRYDEFSQIARNSLASFNLIAQIFHEHAYPMLSEQERRGNYVQLTPRERECLLLSSHGLTAKEIAHKLNRSVPTITMHIQSATNKLGARNRLHAVILASHYRLLEPQ